jgi:enoyl-CoA hydratase/carnithine racemase
MPVTHEKQGHIGVIRFDRPEARNAIDSSMCGQFIAAVDDMESDSMIRVVILTGGNDAFCAGVDLNEFAQGRAGELSTPDGGFAGFVYRDRAQPYIAAVEGPAAGGGFEIALACDLVVASATARFCLPETRLGLIAGAGGVTRLVGAVGTTRAMMITLTGEIIDGHSAFAMGLASVTSAPGLAYEEAVRLAQAIAANSPSAIRESRQMIRLASRVEQHEVLVAQAAARERAWASADAAEGLQAFRSKRAPEWASA